MSSDPDASIAFTSTESGRPSAARLIGRIPRPRLRAGAVVVLVIAALVVAVLVSLLGAGGSVQTIGAAAQDRTGAAADVPAPGSSGRPSAAAGELFVHVLGAVAVPGLYRVPDGSRAFDAIAAAGGLLPEADPAGVNLARFVGDGEQLVVPALGQTPELGVAVAPGAAASAPVNLNTATAEELTTLPRIGEALAARIIAWREANGRFTSVDDLSAVEGIGTKTLDGLRASVTV